MKTAICIISLFAASIALALDPIASGPNGDRVWKLPSPLGTIHIPTLEQYADAGYTIPPSAADLARWAAEDAAAQAEAAALASLPRQEATGIAVLDDAGHWVELVPIADGEPIIAVRVSQSPLNKEQHDAMKAAGKQAHAAKKAARAMALQAAKAAKTQKDFQDAVIVWMESQP